MNRDRIVTAVAWVSLACALASLVVAGVIRFWFPWLKNVVGYPVVGAWVLLPPVWFWWEWVYLCSGLSSTEKDRIKHLHDLARNIWLALVVVLAVIFGIDWKP